MENLTKLSDMSSHNNKKFYVGQRVGFNDSVNTYVRSFNKNSHAIVRMVNPSAYNTVVGLALAGSKRIRYFLQKELIPIN